MCHLVTVTHTGYYTIVNTYMGIIYTAKAAAKGPLVRANANYPALPTFETNYYCKILGTCTRHPSNAFKAILI